MLKVGISPEKEYQNQTRMTEKSAINIVRVILILIVLAFIAFVIYVINNPRKGENPWTKLSNTPAEVFAV